MNQGPLLFSILIPTWNRVAPLLRAVESIGPLSPDMEVVIVDNGSELSLYAELERHLAGRPGIRLSRNEQNLGMVRNWNRCMELAQGEWIGLLCSDDQYCPGAFSRLREIIAARPEPTLIIQVPSSIHSIEVSPAGSETVRNLKLPIGSGNFWHRQLYEQIGGFDERFEYSADGEYWYRAALSFSVIKVREPFAVYMPNNDSYMWATWRRPDFLQQTELLGRTVAGYIFDSALDRERLVGEHVETALWQTVLTIVSCTFLKNGKGDLFRRYFQEASGRATSFSRKRQLLTSLMYAVAEQAKFFFKERLSV